MDEQFIFRKEYRNILLIVMAGSLLAGLMIIWLSWTGPSRIWTNILLNNQFFLGIALGSAFFLAVNRVGMSGWHTVLQRLPEAMTTFLPLAFVLMLLMYFGMSHVYQWTHIEGYDPVFEGRKAWLNLPFFFTRMIFYFAGWIALTWLMKKNTHLLLTTSDIKYHHRRMTFAGIFLVFYGITVSTSSWDWIMSLNRHWYSTIFGWYVLISMFVTSLACIIILLYFLSRQGYMKYLRAEHINDLAVLLFTFSIFWAYQWYSQYFLIWYGNLPEETSYYILRYQDFRVIFFLNLAINFIIPFFGLISSKARRNLKWVTLIAGILVVGHWIDYWLMVMPGALGDKARIGLLEIFFTVLYAAIFIFIVFRSLAQGPLVNKNDPFLEESLTYES